MLLRTRRVVLPRDLGFVQISALLEQLMECKAAPRFRYIELHLLVGFFYSFPEELLRVSATESAGISRYPYSLRGMRCSCTERLAHAR